MNEHYLKDILIFLASIVAVVVLARTGAFVALLEIAETMPVIASFVAGALFTSAFTVAPAMAAIAELSQRGVPLQHLALIGGLGAMLVDFLLFTLLREAVAEPIFELAKAGNGGRIARFIRRGRHRLVGTLLGAIIIASPFPDELGLLLMGLSRARWYTMLAITYLLNAAGITAIALAARTF